MKKLLLFIFLFCVLCSQAQENYLFTHLGTKQGLASNGVGYVQQDNKGFIWLITANNLQRYDGFRFLDFPAGSSIPAGLIHAMLIDTRNRIWLQIGDMGIGYMDADNFSWHPVKLNMPAGFSSKIQGLYMSKDGEISLIYQGYGIVTYDEKSGHFDAKYNPFKMPTGWNVITIWQDKNKNYWMGTNNGLVKYNPVSRKLSYGGHNEENDPVVEKFKDLNTVNFFYVDRVGRNWVGSWPKSTGFSLKSLEPDGSVKEWSQVLAAALKNVYHTVFTILETDEADWIYGTNLLAKLDANSGKVYPIASNMPGEYSIRYDIINHLFLDREKNLWAATNKGLYYFNPASHVFNSVYNRLPGKDSLFSSEITGILETSSGETLVSTWGTGIFSYDKNFNPVPSKIFPGNAGLNEGMVWSMVEAGNGNIWWGKQDGWLGSYDARSKKIDHIQVPLAEKRTIRQILADKRGNLWMGTQGGRIIKYDVVNNKYKLIYQSKGVIGRLYCSSRNEIWAGTDYDGLYRIDAASDMVLEHYTDHDPAGRRLIINGVAEMVEYDDSTMLFVSNGLNVLHLNTGKFTYLFAGVELYNLMKDDRGLIWMSSSGKIISFSLQNPVMHYSFDERDGLDNFSFNSGAAALLSNRNMVFGTSHNMVVFDPRRAMTGIRKYQDIQVAGISVNDKDLPVDSVLKAERLELGPGNISIRTWLTTNSFQNTFAMYYMLEDMDKDWKPAPQSGELNLNYLPPGYYVLKAAVLDENRKIISVKSIPIHIRTPFYKTWWFFTLLAVVLLIELFWLDRQRMKRKEELQKMRTGIAEKLHKEVNSTLGNINILSEMALLKADLQPEKAKEFVEQIKDKSSTTLTAMEDMLWAITPGNDSMEKAATRMQEFIEGINNRGDAKIEMVVDEKLRNIRFDMQWRYEAFLLFKESIKGLLQAGVRSCKVHIGYEKPELSFLLQFPNQGCDMQQLNNYFQSRELAARTDALKARLHIVVHKSNSEIECYIPSLLN